MRRLVLTGPANGPSRQLADLAAGAFEAVPADAHGARSCGHVAATRAAIICVSHPRDGLRCVACTRRHIADHDRADEFRCDHCGTVDAAITGAMYGGPLPVRVEGRAFTAYVATIGLGLCTRCSLAARDIPGGVG